MDSLCQCVGSYENSEQHEHGQHSAHRDEGALKLQGGLAWKVMHKAGLATCSSAGQAGTCSKTKHGMHQLSLTHIT